MARKIFISYARVNRPVAEQLDDDFKGCGYSAFFDSELAGGQSWWEELLRQIEQCDVFVPVLSDAYLSSTACEREAAYAIALGKPFLPVKIENVSPGLFPKRIAEAQWITYKPDDRNSLLNLVRGTSSVQPAPPLPEPMPPRPEVPISYLTDLRGQVQAPGELPRGDQLRLLAELKARLHGDEAEVARRLLKMLRDRPDVSHQVATEIDQLQADQPPRPAPKPVPPPPRPPAPSPSPPPAGAKPDNYLVWSILATVMCCPLVGWLGIYFAVQVDKKYLAGDLAGAQAAAKQAATWSIVAAGLGLLGTVLYVLAMAAGSFGSF